MSDSERSLLRDMGVTEANVERRLKFVGFEPADAKRLIKLGSTVGENVDTLADSFFDALAKQPESRPLMQDKNALATAKQFKREHLLAMVSGPYDQGYAEDRLRLAKLYSSVGLPTTMFLGAFNRLMRSIGETLRKAHGDTKATFDGYMSLQKVAYFDVGLIVDALTFERERVIHRQQESIRELSTPVLQLRERMLLVPLIGVVDTFRARQLTEGLLQSIRDARARVVVMDITGVAAVDSKVANHLMQTVDAARLMGATVIMSGLSSEVANALVTVGVDVRRFNTVGDLQGGIEESERLLGLRVVEAALV